LINTHAVDAGTAFNPVHILASAVIFYWEREVCILRQRLAERGIYTVLDMHQDVLSSLYLSYDGVPRWLIESFPEPTNPYPWPLEWPLDAWALGYLTQV
jgi:hypothetical protein